MFKVLKGYVRRHVESKVRPKRRAENATKKQRTYCSRFCDKSFFPDYLRRVNRKFGNCRRSLIGLQETAEEKGTDDTFKTETYLRNPWIEAIGWSGTLAFGWALSQNFHFYVRRRTLQDYTASHHYENINLPKHLCPHLILKNILLSSVLAQPDDLVNVKSLLKPEKVSVEQTSLPIFGPKTADQVRVYGTSEQQYTPYPVLNEATDGVKKVHNETVGELENRLGLRCMSKQQYRRAVIHFAAGSALQNSAATFNLAQCYELGLGTRQSYKKAAKCYRAASDQGNASATYNLAVFYAHGYGGLKIDRNKAIQLLESAVALGEPHAKQLLERYVSAKKKHDSKTTSEEKSKNIIEIADVQSRFAALRLSLTRPNQVIENNVQCTHRKSNSVSTDDGLASEYESSNSSDVSCSGSSCQSESSSERIYRDRKIVEGSSSSQMKMSLCHNHSKMNKLALKPESSKLEYPTSFFLKMYRLSGTSLADS